MYVRNATKPIQGTFIAALWKAKMGAWLAKQECGCVLINHCLGYNGREEVKNFSKVAKIIAKIEACF